MSGPDLSALRIHRDIADAQPPGRGRRALVWAAALVVAAAGGLLLWRSDLLPRAAPEVRVARVRVQQAGGAEEVLTATGYIVPQLRSIVSSRTSGRLEWLGVDEGSRVEAGQVIARLDNADLAAQVAEAKASLAQARAALEQARASLWEADRELQRQRRLLEEGITTPSDHDAAQRAYDVARAGLTASQEAVRAAEARVRLTEANFEKTFVRAPFAGVVIAKSAEVGEMVAAGAFSGQPTGGAIVTVADFSTLEMEADINETNLSRVSTGQPALVVVDAVPGRKYRGVLRQIVPAADRQKAVVQAKVKLLDLDERLVPDMSARVTFTRTEVSEQAAAAPPRLFVPSAAVRLEGGSPFVLTVREERAERVPVTLGESLGDLREVVSGLRGDETVVVEGGDELRSGDRVRLAS
ncbi:MAG TPA: efflux RND transporter periplasmic adaptor subunit [Candidatus Polarisedimenticolia bacterium]|nr:efflux RND transporter periplasmic adaptor subunit [Candidatus Polarisedimenticolia bacterium]